MLTDELAKLQLRFPCSCFEAISKQMRNQQLDDLKSHLINIYGWVKNGIIMASRLCSCLVAQLCLTLFLHPWDFPGKNTGVGSGVKIGHLVKNYENTPGGPWATRAGPDT